LEKFLIPPPTSWELVEIFRVGARYKKKRGRFGFAEELSIVSVLIQRR
jgi:hypothetical protein